MLNMVQIIGHLGRDPEVRYTPEETAIANLAVATNETWKDKSGEKQERAEWHRVVLFGKVAEIAGEYLKKGSKVYIEGSLRTSDWERDGQKHYRTEVIARDMQMLDSRGGAGGGGPTGFESQDGNAYGGPPQPSQSNNAATLSDDDFDDDIPF